MDDFPSIFKDGRKGTMFPKVIKFCSVVPTDTKLTKLCRLCNLEGRIMWEIEKH